MKLRVSFESKTIFKVFYKAIFIQWNFYLFLFMWICRGTLVYTRIFLSYKINMQNVLHKQNFIAVLDLLWFDKCAHWYQINYLLDCFKVKLLKTWRRLFFINSRLLTMRKVDIHFKTSSRITVPICNKRNYTKYPLFLFLQILFHKLF